MRLGDLLAELARVHRRALLDGVGLEPVAGHLVEEDAAETAADDDRERARGGRLRVEQGERLSRRIGGDPLGGAAGDELEAAVAAEGLEAGDDDVSAAGHRLRAEPHPGAVVGGVQALGVCDLNAAAAVGVGGHHLVDLGAGGAGGLVAGAQQVGLLRCGHVGGVDVDLLQLGRLGGAQRLRLGAPGAERRGDRVGGALEIGLGEPVDV